MNLLQAQQCFAPGAAALMAAVAQDDSIFEARWAALGDEALLAHFRSRREVDIDLIVDEEECKPAKIEALMAGRFEFNGETHGLTSPIRWLENPSVDVEWHILMHKFYYSAGLARAYRLSGRRRFAQRWMELVGSWIADTPPGFIAADVTGRRVQNWIYSLRGFVWHGEHHVAPVPVAFFRRLLESLHEQVEFLCANLTPKRNHRTLELYAIFLAGVAFPEMKRAAFWRAFALQETVNNMRGDLLTDGVHCELSTDYHHLAVRNWLNVRSMASRNGVAVPAEMDRLLEHALGFSLYVHKPDGSVPSLSDGDARGFLPLLAQGADLYGRDDMRWVATQGAAGELPRHLGVHFAASGYTVLRNSWGSQATDFPNAQYLVFDSGPLGEGNHGHFDCLNFELAAAGRSLIVDPGRYTYSEATTAESPENWRVRFRSTAAHNTVCVDGLNQTRYVPKMIKEASRHSEGSLRHKISGPAPDASLREFAHSQAFSLLHGRACSHEYDAMHDRTIAFIDGKYWVVSDALRAPSVHDYTVNFQLGSEAAGRSHLSAGSDVQLESPQLRMAAPRRSGHVAQLHDSWVSPRYGLKQPAPALRFAARAANADFAAVLLPFAGGAASMAVCDVQVMAANGEPHLALRIEWRSGREAHVDTWFHSHMDEAGLWEFGGLRFFGRWIHLRHGSDGRVRRAISHAGASLHELGETLPVQVAGPGHCL